MESFPSRLGRFEVKTSARKSAIKKTLKTKVKGLLSNHHARTSSTGAQPTSKFHRLPYDIRLLIYQQLILDLGEVLHINYRSQRKCQPCLNTAADGQEIRDHSRNAWGETHHSCFFEAQSELSVAELCSVFNLAYSCRQTYQEVTNFVYSTVTFHIIDMDSAYQFINSIPQHQLNQIRTLRLSWMISTQLYEKEQFYFIPKQGSRRRQVIVHKQNKASQHIWEDTCQKIATMSALSDLEIIISSLGKIISEKDLLFPLLAITNPSDHFQVHLPWKLKEGETNPEEDDLPFRVRRQSGEGIYYRHENINGCRGRGIRCREVLLCPLYTLVFMGRAIYDPLAAMGWV